MPAIAATPDLTPNADAARDKLIVALDYPTVRDAEQLVDRLGDEVSFYKVGLGLQLGGGDQFARRLIDKGKRVFLDYKYYDIEETIRNAVARAADMGISFLTVHGSSSILKGAVDGRGQSGLKIFCVTVLTSMDADDVREMGFQCDPEALVLHRAVKALELGVDGVIASAREAAAIKARAGNKLMVVSPGIRPQGSRADDQKRVTTPADAMRAGADYLVVGRPIYANDDPLGAARRIIAEMADASA